MSKTSRPDIKTCLITGASTGIGKALTSVFARNGFEVLAVARDKGKLKRLEESIGGDGRVETISCDVSDSVQVDGLSEILNRRSKPIDVLINNAGVGTFKPLLDTEPEMWRRTLDVNLTGSFLVTRAVIPGMIARGAGHIFNMISVAGKKGFPNCSAYSASKFGLNGFTEVLREEMRAYKIKVTGVFAGAVETPFWDGIDGDFDRRQMVRPDDIADAVWMAVNQSATSLVEEIVVRPSCGDL